MSKRNAPTMTTDKIATSSDGDSPSLFSNQDIARGKRSKTIVSSILSSISEDLICSISHELMVDPVSTLDGVTYERKEIEAWLQENDTSPVTNLSLDAKTLIPNIIAKNTIAKLLASGKKKVRDNWEQRKRCIDLIRAQNLFDEEKIEEAAELGHPKAQGVMSNRCYNGSDGQTQDNVKSVYWARKAASGGDMSGQFWLGFAYEKALGSLAKNYALAVMWHTKAAEQGCPLSMNNLGALYEAGGHGVAINLKTAFSWYSKSAKKGGASGQFNLGCCYYEGMGVVKNKTAARRCHQNLVDRNDNDTSSIALYSKAQRELGTMMIKGEGGGQDAEEACALWKKAAAQGDEKAQEHLEKLKTMHFEHCNV